MGKRRTEEKQREDLADLGAIVLERPAEPAAGHELDNILDAIRPALKDLAEIQQHAPAEVGRDDLDKVFFHELAQPPEGTETYGRLASHVEPRDPADKIPRGFQ